MAPKSPVLDERAVAWYENSELSDADEDLLYMYWEMAKGFRRFRNTVIPEDLARLFKIPSAQLIATLPISGDLDAPASSVLGHHTRDIHNALIGWIEKAFDGVPVPQAPSRTLYQAEAWDDYEFCDRSRDHMGRWQDLPEQHLLDCNWSLSYLDEHGIHYYFPAVMCFDLRYGLAAPGGWLDRSHLVLIRSCWSSCPIAALLAALASVTGPAQFLPPSLHSNKNPAHEQDQSKS